MGTKNKKITGSHTTTIELASKIVSFLERDIHIYKIVFGVISNNTSGKSSNFSVKILDETSCVLVRVTQNSSTQELRFYSKNFQESKLALARFVRDNKWQLRFKNLA